MQVELGDGNEPHLVSRVVVEVFRDRSSTNSPVCSYQGHYVRREISHLNP